MRRVEGVHGPLRLFVKIDPPAKPVLGVQQSWWTWSREMREWFDQWGEKLQGLPEPELRRFGRGEYAYSLSLDLPTEGASDLRRGLERVALGFRRLTPHPGLILFDRLIDDQIAGGVLRKLLALVRSLMVERANDEAEAIYAPLGVAGGTEGGAFPVHADLYPPTLLLNIFDRVPTDGSGASLFVPSNVVLRAFGESRVVPSRVSRRLQSLLTEPAQGDRYAKLYDILHGPHPWTRDMERVMKANCIRVSFNTGQGYLVHDRLWLHGREAPRGGVSKNRLHRFVFDTAGTKRLRTATFRRLA
jgi:hypothetical protein